MSWAASRFDGRSAAGEVVLVRIDGDALSIVSRRVQERVPIAALDAGERFAHAPAMIRLPGGATLEISDPGRTLPAALAAAGVRESWVVRMQQAWAAVVVALALLIGAGIWAYVEGVPLAAQQVAAILPASTERAIGENVLELIDRHRYRPSGLPEARRARIAARFREAAAVAAPGVDVRVEFRSGDVNAFALPGGIIVVLDELVNLAGDDDRVLGVLGHELGHVVHRHSTRQLLQALGTGALASLFWGDFSGVAANVPIVLGVMRYGRGFENEADDFALAFLRANGLSPRPLYEFFLRVGDAEPRRSRGSVPDFLSTHPDFGDRTERLRRETEAFESARTHAPALD